MQWAMMRDADRLSKLHRPRRGGGMVGNAARGMHSPATERWPGNEKGDEWRWRSPVGWHAGRSLSQMPGRCGWLHRTDCLGSPPQQGQSLPDRHSDRCAASLRWVPTCRAWPGVEAASSRVSCWSGEMTWMSSAAGRPWHQVGRRMSASLDCEAGTTPTARNDHHCVHRTQCSTANIWSKKSCSMA